MFKKIPEQSEKDFLSECDIEENSLEAMLALRVRELLASYALSFETKISKAKHVFAKHKIVDDLNICHLDSMNLIDVILELEKDGISISDEDAQRLFVSNENNLTVAEIINELLIIIKGKRE